MSIYVDIEKIIGDFILKVAFEAEDETLALLGASGCGKSMTLKCIAGIEKPDRGRIVLDDIVLFDSDKGINLPAQQRQVGLMFQNYALFPNMTVYQNIMTGAKREKNRQKRQEMVDLVVRSFGLTELLNRFPHQLSGGQQQRVALARMLVSSPKIILMDEPFSALDSHLRFRVEQEVREVIQKFGKTVILVSHDRDEVYRMADSIAVMDQGSIEAYGEKHDVFRHLKTRMSAMLTGCKNISAIRKISENRIYAVDWGIQLSVSSPVEEAAYVGIRMHDIVSDGKENIVRCRVADEIENPFSYTVMLRPIGCENSVPIGWEMEKAIWKMQRKEELTISIPEDKLILLR